MARLVYFHIRRTFVGTPLASANSTGGSSICSRKANFKFGQGGNQDLPLDIWSTTTTVCYTPQDLTNQTKLALDTGDSQWNQETIHATTWQAEMNGQFMPSNQSFDMGNDDQAFWAFTAMNAAETNFPPPTVGYPSWATMCDIVFNLQVNRWDTQYCGGGLHWQVFSTNPGYGESNLHLPDVG